MGKESSLWDLVREELKLFAHLERVENRVNEGTPDVNYCFNGGRGEGWLELKDIESWPARPDTVVHIEHVTEVQRNWWRQRRASGGAVFVLLRVHNPTREYLLFDGVAAAKYLGLVTRSGLIEIAQSRFGPTFSKVLIIKALTKF
jgi:hypothetical protein